ncbi:NAD-dependent deacetylase [Fictibacillus iocasae]|uniref:protein acetyllysine N-acetyltransferase n=1 Tax=Fictibacillus iocasae TaxID=2715437 RepID=A0ABW2NSZ3_9BACL
MDRKILELADWMKKSKQTVLLTGAGMSTESGIPDFRSQTGLWAKYDPAYVSSTDALRDHYDLFRDFYSLRIQDITTLSPHEGYHALSEMEAKGFITSIATQNVDGFHELSGAKDVWELHGSLRTVSCHDCGCSGTHLEFTNKQSCSHCNGKLRPDIVLFGEMLPQDVWNKAISAIEQSDLVIVIGTSLQVYPVNQLPTLTKGKTVLINNEASSHSHPFDLTILGSARDTLLQLSEAVLGN